MKNPKNILITGASSGLGAAMALAYAAPGQTLFLGGRNQTRLADIALQAQAQGAQVITKIIDVADADAMKLWIEESDDFFALDLVIANAGISGLTDGQSQDEPLLATNVQGVLNTLHPALARMKQRQKGQIALMSSLAGFRGFAGAAGYCASKAFVRVYSEALRLDCRPYNVAINVICPGFVRTPMTDVNDFTMPFLMEPTRAAALIKTGLGKNKGRISFPWPLAAVVKLVTICPSSWLDLFLARLPQKGPKSIKK
ncbi:MAG: SDR family NAD(P)-dependent oxidoreductase [Alphaproteobacteria bacterium]|nr:SDR family NAD(P)-dependent oxidoreductase [Alphaproteobacteria bacterium]